MPVPTQMYSALLALRAEPSHVSPSAPKLPSLPMTIGRLEAGLQQRAEVDAGQAHVRRHHHQPAIGIDHAGHGDADGRQVAGA